MDVKKRVVAENMAIFSLVVVGCKNLIAGLPFPLTKHALSAYGRLLHVDTAVLHGSLSFVLGGLMLLVVHGLSRRIKMAWLLAILALSGSLTLQMIHIHQLSPLFIAVELAVLVVLIWGHEDFCRQGDQASWRRSLQLVAVIWLFLLLNAVVGIFLLRAQLHGVADLGEAVGNALSLLFLLDPGELPLAGRGVKFYVQSLIGLNWLGIGLALWLLLRPLIHRYIYDQNDRHKVREIVLAHGQNPMSYLALEQDKSYFFAANGAGVIAYTVVGKVCICCGDMICAPAAGFDFLHEFLQFCQQNGYQPLFLNVTDAFLPLYQAAGFGQIKFGEDALFALETYSLSGGKVAKVRAAVNHATKHGISVHEYCPNRSRDPRVEEAMQGITAEWLADKGGTELIFMVGGLGLDAPLDRRYFYAEDAAGKIQGFMVFIPYAAGTAYLADVTRRHHDAQQGVLEKILIDAFAIFRAEGVAYGSLGLSPLYQVSSGEQSGLTEKAFDYMYENMNQFYDFKALHASKAKYDPNEWAPRYVVYYPRPFTLAFAYALIKAQLPGPLREVVAQEVKGNIAAHKAAKVVPHDES